MDKLDDQILLDNLGKIAFTVDKAYASKLDSKYGVLYFDEKYNHTETEDENGRVTPLKIIEYASNIRALEVKRWVHDKQQKIGDCFKNVLNLFADGDHTLALVVKRSPQNTHTYFVVKNEGPERNEDSAKNIELLEDSIKGNFQGSFVNVIKDEEDLETLFSFDEKINIEGREEELIQSIALLMNNPSQYSEDYMSQGLDKLLNGIVPETEEESYTVVFLAESISSEQVREIILGYEELATAIEPFSQYQFQVGDNEVRIHGETSSIANTETITDTLFRTHCVNIGINENCSFGKSVASSSIGKKVGQMLIEGGKNAVVGAVVGTGEGPGLGTAVGAVAGAIYGAVKGAITAPNNVNHSSGISMGALGGYGYSWGKAKAISGGKAKMTGSNSGLSKGTNESVTRTYKSHQICNVLQKLESIVERLNKSQATGTWKYSTYVLAKDSKTTKKVANYLKAITQGQNSFLEPSVVQEWSHFESNGTCPFDEIKKYIAHFSHPVFATFDKDGKNAMLLTGTSYVGTEDLSNVIMFPQKSMQGLPVCEGVQFGREPHSLDSNNRNMDIGCGYHMYSIQENTRIGLNKEELTKHTFITGSTGSGKSNTVYRILDRIREENENISLERKVKFLVIEPVKGEYRKQFGDYKDVTTYGTNPKTKGISLLKIDPFSFPEKIHISVHTDRLVEIFNVCWPMYAAMPAILKDAIERAYVSCGWDLIRSINKYDKSLFPTFNDVVEQIRIVLRESEYSQDNKGDYTGALVTRLKSLTNGLNGIIFSPNAIADEKLFDENVIVDLSSCSS